MRSILIANGVCDDLITVTEEFVLGEITKDNFISVLTSKSTSKSIDCFYFVKDRQIILDIPFPVTYGWRRRWPDANVVYFAFSDERMLEILEWQKRSGVDLFEREKDEMRVDVCRSDITVHYSYVQKYV